MTFLGSAGPLITPIQRSDGLVAKSATRFAVLQRLSPGLVIIEFRLWVGHSDSGAADKNYAGTCHFGASFHTGANAPAASAAGHGSGSPLQLGVSGGVGVARVRLVVPHRGMAAYHFPAWVPVPDGGATVSFSVINDDANDAITAAAGVVVRPQG